MDLTTLFGIPGMRDALEVLIGAALVSGVAVYQRTRFKPLADEYVRVRTRFFEMKEDGFDKKETGEIVDYVTGLFAKFGGDAA